MINLFCLMARYAFFLISFGLLIGVIAPLRADDLSFKAQRFTYADGGTAMPPNGWAKFCNRYTSECNIKTATPQDITSAPEAWRALVFVNNWVNDFIKPMTDRKHWGVINQWVYPDDGYGDCKAYTLLKRKILMQFGFPRSALLIAIVWTKQNIGHSVLIVRTNEGDYVLDNLSRWIFLWTLTDYDYVKRQSVTDPNLWVYINNVPRNRSPVQLVTADPMD